MLEFILKRFYSTAAFIICNFLNVNSIECFSANNQEFKIRTEIINLNTNEPLFYTYSIKINRCKRSRNTINDPYAKICVPDQTKNTNVKAFNLMSRANQTTHIKWQKHVNVDVD